MFGGRVVDRALSLEIADGQLHLNGLCEEPYAI